MAKRTDAHCPKNFKPEDYAYAGMFMICPPAEASFFDPGFAEHNQAVKSEFLHGPRPSAPMYPLGKCEHCGATFNYGALFVHVPTGEKIQVGNVCADEAFGHKDRRSYDLEKLRTRRAAAKLRGGRRAKAAKFLLAHPDLEVAFDRFADRNEILADMRDRLGEFGKLSDKQVAFALKLLSREAAKHLDTGTGMECEHCGAEDHEVANCPSRKQAPTGRQEVEVRLVHSRVEDGHYGVQIKGLYVSDDGWKAWDTVPNDLLRVERRLNPDEFKRYAVRLRATFERSADDGHFAFIKRPSVAFVNGSKRLLEDAEATVHGDRPICLTVGDDGQLKRVLP